MKTPIMLRLISRKLQPTNRLMTTAECMLTLLCTFGAANPSDEHHAKIMVDITRPVHTTLDEFLSLGMDTNLIRNHWETWDFRSTRLHTLAKGLSPAYLRFCGTDSDRMLFTHDYTESNAIPQKVYVPSPGPPFPASNFTMNTNDWDNINKFAAEVGWKIMFGFNAQLRRGADWDAENAKDLLRYSIRKGYSSNLDFELGNEPDLFPFQVDMQMITPKQLAEDHRQLRNLLDTEFGNHFSSAKLHGPGISFVWPIEEKVKSVAYLQSFLQYLPENVIETITWHQYYGGSELKYVENYTDPLILDQYISQCRRVMQTVNSSPHKLPVWQGETSSTYAPPGSTIDMSYVAGFMLLDKLGVSAKNGMELVIRQTFYGFWFALVDEELLPTPNYWTALLYRRLIGRIVLDATIRSGNMQYIRTYANCVAQTTRYNDGAVVVYAMNLHDFDVMLDFSSLGEHVYEYLFDPADYNLVSTGIRLNGRLLTLMDGGSLPDLVTYGRLLTNPHDVVLPAKRFAFYVVNDANAAACTRRGYSNVDHGGEVPLTKYALGADFCFSPQSKL